MAGPGWRDRIAAEAREEFSRSACSEEEGPVQPAETPPTNRTAPLQVMAEQSSNHIPTFAFISFRFFVLLLLRIPSQTDEEDQC